MSQNSIISHDHNHQIYYHFSLSTVLPISSIKMKYSCYLLENYIEVGIIIAVILLRVFARTKVVGFKGWQGDDYLIWVVLVNISQTFSVHQTIEANCSKGDEINTDCELATPR